MVDFSARFVGLNLERFGIRRKTTRDYSVFVLFLCKYRAFGSTYLIISSTSGSEEPEYAMVVLSSGVWADVEILVK